MIRGIHSLSGRRRTCSILVLLAATLLPARSSAQAPALFPEQGEGRSLFVNGRVDYQLASTGITSGFTRKLMRGEFLDSLTKQKVLDRLKDNNRFGGHFQGGLQLGINDSLFGKPGLAGFIDMRTRTIFNAGFTKGLFQTVFFGNRDEAGQHVDFHPFNMQYLTFQQVRLGIIHSSDKFRWGIALSLLKGQRNMQIETTRGDFYTYPDGSQIDLDIAATMQESDTGYVDMMTVAGVGGSADLFLELRPSEKSLWRLEIGDLGAIRWVGGQAGTYDIDTTYQWEGWEIDDIFSLKDSIFGDASNTDSIINSALPNKTKEAYISRLPASFHLMYRHSLADSNTVIQAGAHYLLQANYAPYVYARATYKIDEYFTAGGELAYGGYAGLQVGLEFALEMGAGWKAVLGSHNFTGHLFPDGANGQGIYFALNKVF